MFIKRNDPKIINRAKPLDDIDKLDDDEGSSDTGTHSQYRANYPVTFDPHALEDNFFKSLEGRIK